MYLLMIYDSTRDRYIIGEGRETLGGREVWKRTAFLSREYRSYSSLLLVMSKITQIEILYFKID